MHQTPRILHSVCFFITAGLMWKTSAPGSIWLVPKKSWLGEQSVLMVPFSSCLGRSPTTSSPELPCDGLMGQTSPSLSSWCRWSTVPTELDCLISFSVMSSELLSWHRLDGTTTTLKPPFPYHSTSESKCISIVLRQEYNRRKSVCPTTLWCCVTTLHANGDLCNEYSEVSQFTRRTRHTAITCDTLV